MRFGIFVPPIHRTGINPTLALHRTLELVEHWAKIFTLARGMGTVPPIAEGELQKLLEARKKAGLLPLRTETPATK